MKTSYIITARNSAREVYFFVDSPTQGATMWPNSFYIAREFNGKEAAKSFLRVLRSHYQGLFYWKVEKLSSPQ